MPARFLNEAPAFVLAPDSKVAGSVDLASMAPSPSQDVLGLLAVSGWMGQACIVAALIVWVMFWLPVTPLEVATGYIYGPWIGFVVALSSKTVGSIGAFLLARHAGLCRGTYRGLLAPSALALEVSAKASTMPMLIGLWLAPLPPGLQAYGLGLGQEVKLKPAVMSSFVVNAPFAALWASAGASCHSIMDALAVKHDEEVQELSDDVPRQFILGRILPSIVVLGLLVYAICRSVCFAQRKGASINRNDAELEGC
mmetsp:Transcript_131618/g.281432  ORF Transcript_131618/g.281432 Transcript_131618/m.281432 type:complete len:254 (-) Transcript_131618:115-876(-)